MGKFFLGCLAIFVVGIGISIYEESKLTPAEKYANACKDHTMAVVMALGFARSRLNLADRPEAETAGTWKIAKPINPSDKNCSFEVADHIVFKNETGGKSRRYMRAIVSPSAEAPGSWRLLDLSIL